MGSFWKNCSISNFPDVLNPWFCSLMKYFRSEVCSEIFLWNNLRQSFTEFSFQTRGGEARVGRWSPAPAPQSAPRSPGPGRLGSLRMRRASLSSTSLCPLCWRTRVGWITWPSPGWWVWSVDWWTSSIGLRRRETQPLSNSKVSSSSDSGVQ